MQTNTRLILVIFATINFHKRKSLHKSNSIFIKVEINKKCILYTKLYSMGAFLLILWVKCIRKSSCKDNKLIKCILLDLIWSIDFQQHCNNCSQSFRTRYPQSQSMFLSFSTSSDDNTNTSTIILLLPLLKTQHIYHYPPPSLTQNSTHLPLSSSFPYSKLNISTIILILPLLKTQLISHGRITTECCRITGNKLGCWTFWYKKAVSLLM